MMSSIINNDLRYQLLTWRLAVLQEIPVGWTTWTDQQKAPKVPRTLAAIGTSMLTCCKGERQSLVRLGVIFGASVTIVLR